MSNDSYNGLLPVIRVRSNFEDTSNLNRFEILWVSMDSSAVSKNAISGQSGHIPRLGVKNGIFRHVCIDMNFYLDPGVV